MFYIYLSPSFSVLGREKKGLSLKNALVDPKKLWWFHTLPCRATKKRLALLACGCYFFTSCANVRRFHANCRRIHVNFRRTVLRVFMHYSEAKRGLVFIFTFSASLLPWVQDILVQGEKSTNKNERVFLFSKSWWKNIDDWRKACSREQFFLKAISPRICEIAAE